MMMGDATGIKIYSGWIGLRKNMTNRYYKMSLLFKVIRTDKSGYLKIIKFPWNFSRAVHVQKHIYATKIWNVFQLCKTHGQSTQYMI